MFWRYLRYEAEKCAELLTTYPIPPPFKSLSLRNTPLAKVLSRHTSRGPSIDEFYHENSKYSKININLKSIGGYLSGMRLLVAQSGSEVTREFVKIDKMYKSLDTMPKHIQKILHDVREGAPIFLGVYVLHRNGNRWSLFKYDRIADYLLLVKDISMEDATDLLKENVFIMQDLETLPLNIQNSLLILFIYGNHTVSKLIYGARGYRVILLECGKMIKLIENAASSLNYTSTSTHVFYDGPINRFLGLDGLELSVHEVIVIGG